MDRGVKQNLLHYLRGGEPVYLAYVLNTGISKEDLQRVLPKFRDDLIEDYCIRNYPLFLDYYFEEALTKPFLTWIEDNQAWDMLEGDLRDLMVRKTWLNVDGGVLSDFEYYLYDFDRDFIWIEDDLEELTDTLTDIYYYG